MKQAAERVEADLQGNVLLQALLDSAQYWELAPKGEETPFVNYRIRENKRPSKDHASNYDLEVFCFDSSLTKAAELAELVKTALIAKSHRYQSGESGYTDDEAKEGYIKLNFNFNI